LTFLLAERIGRGNKRLSMLAIVSALAEKQNIGPKKSLIGLNSEIASIATSIGILNMKADLIFNNLDYKPLHEALAYNISPYIEGITWNKENCYKILKNTGIVTHRNGKFRTFAEISDQEKNMILDAITKFIFLSNPKNEKENDNIENISDSFIGYIFEFPNEDRNSILKNGMEFAFALNSCIKYEKIGLGIGICMGERNNTVTEIEKIVFDYKTNIMNCLEKIFREKWRLLDNDSTVFVNGEGILNEGITNDISIILSESISFKTKLLLLRTLSNDNSYNFYVKKGIEYGQKKN
jgi:RecJ-like exonuclease